MVDYDLNRVVFQRLADPETGQMVKRALAQGVVLDTWMNGEKEEQFGEEAEVAPKRHCAPEPSFPPTRCLSSM
ncbi:MAG TPA: hypothetical protein VMW83_12570 [Spirochaetia bacterium]|nr:hypothetical protein [Spirochaetia bacterium]